MGYEQILYEVSDHIATITLNRPDKLNAWTIRMAAEVRHAMFQADGDDTVRVIVVTGAGKAYCAGADMNMLQGLQLDGAATALSVDDASLSVSMDLSLPAAFRGEYSYPLGLHKPVIAAVNGVAVGLGFSYMLYYDLRIASERARFGTVFARRGLVAEHGSAWLLPRLIGMHHACDLLYSARIINADEAQRMGLLNRVVPHDSLMAAVREAATEMATLCSTRSLRVMKRQLYGDLFKDLGAAMEEADTEMLLSFGSDDFREGVASFMERRPPRFTGR
ncbi:MAG: enoyl-CoA hydratase/isomerase family protein [Deltaproteobacteria bacterium]|nr:enoyl-CoA hydratase/isomerase family protein [Deltaproteobacteria bacterium]